MDMFIKDESQENDATFAGALGLDMFQEQHHMVSDLDLVAPLAK